jgi:5,5'-dehydrodivanillate O-demethylase
MAVEVEQVADRSSSRDAVDFARTGPGTLAGRYLRTFWQPVARADEVPTGRAVPVRIMSEDFTLYRGQSGEAHALAFRCAHRGTQLSTGWVEGDELRCFYHGWKYGPNGQCVEQPAEAEPFCNRIRIRSYPVQEYLGLIFAYLGAGEPPPFPRYTAYEGEGVLRVGKSAPLPVNYFNRVDNAPDHAHLVFVHSPFLNDSGMPTFENVETDYGVMTTAHFPGDHSINQTHLVMPNVSLFPSGVRQPGDATWTDFIAWSVPADDASYRFFQVMMTHGVTEPPARHGSYAALKDAPNVVDLGFDVLGGRERISEHLERPDIFELQDFVAQRGQGIIADREHEHHGRSDYGVLLVRKLWEHDMLRIEAGLPRNEWPVPEALASLRMYE